MRPAHAFMLGAGVASLVGAASAAAVFLALQSAPPVADQEPAKPAEAVAAADPCQGQAWPHFDRRCLAHKDATRAPRIVGTEDVEPPQRSPVAATAAAAPPPPAVQGAAPPPAPDLAPVGQATASLPSPSPAPLPQPRPDLPAEAASRTTGAVPAEPAPVRAAASSPDAAEAPARKSKPRKARARERAPRDPAPRGGKLAAVEAEIAAMERRGELPGPRERERRVIILREGGERILPFLR